MCCDSQQKILYSNAEKSQAVFFKKTAGRRGSQQFEHMFYSSIKISCARRYFSRQCCSFTGSIKREYPGYGGYITITLREVRECVEAGADIVAVDCTNMPRGDGLTPAAYVRQIRAEYPQLALMADCATLEEAVAAHAAGADLVGTTMNGYTPQTAVHGEGPNAALVEALVKTLPCPVLAEGRIHTPQQARQMLELGAWAVVVGGAITRPLEIAQRFMDAVRDL